jgi:hypothetical protein
MFKYKNVSGLEQTLINFGVVKPDQEIHTERVIENPNFVLVEGGEAPQGVVTEPVQPEQTEQPEQQEQTNNEENQ